MMRKYAIVRSSRTAIASIDRILSRAE